MKRIAFNGQPHTTFGPHMANPLQKTGQPASPWNPPNAPHVVRGTTGVDQADGSPLGAWGSTGAPK
jgi:hypothetical protein